VGSTEIALAGGLPGATRTLSLSNRTSETSLDGVDLEQPTKKQQSAMANPRLRPPDLALEVPMCAKRVSQVSQLSQANRDGGFMHFKGVTGGVTRCHRGVTERVVNYQAARQAKRGALAVGAPMA
jgi:hypothetical protein